MGLGFDYHALTDKFDIRRINANFQKLEDATLCYTTMPTAAAGNLGQIARFTGTTGTYIHGHVYECVSSGGGSPTYSWAEIQGIPTGGTTGQALIKTSATDYSTEWNNLIRENIIINPSFAINQRAKTGTVTLAAGVYGHDRWKAGASGCTYTFATSENVTTITISAGTLIQIVEGLNLQSGTVCLSWTGTAQGKIGAGSYSASGVTGTATGGANLNIEFNTGTVSNVQLNYGSVALPFVPRSYADELRLCQRYYEKSYNQSVAPGAISALGQQSRIISTGYFTCDTSIIFSMVKRAAPTVIVYSPQNGASGYAREDNASSIFVANKSVAVGSIGERMASFQSGDGSFTIGNVLRWHWVADAEL